MRRLAFLGTLALAACGPAKYDQEITCGSFHADHVAAWSYAARADEVVVKWPDGRYTILLNQSCLIQGMEKR